MATGRAHENGQEVELERLYKVVRAAVSRGLKRQGTAREDLVQEALTRTLVSLREGPFTGDSQLSTWASAIAQRVALEPPRMQYRVIH